MKKLLLLFCALTVSGFLLSQVQIQSLLPSGGLVQKNQLWNAIIVNVSGTELSGRLEISLKDRVSGQDLLTGTSSNITLRTGATNLNFNTVSPVQYNYLGSLADNSMQALIPVGQYIICYSLNIFGHKQMMSECVNFDVEALSPPQLTFPQDSSHLEVSPSNFTWTPPTPVQLFNNLRYDYILTELLPGQKAAQAVMENIPVVSAPVTSNHYTYGLNAPKLEPGKWYAWQVIARDHNNYAGKSDVWIFSIDSVKKEAPKEIFVPYITLSSTASSSAMVKLSDNSILVYHYSYEAPYETKLVIYDEQNREVTGQKVSVSTGANYLAIPSVKQLSEHKSYKVVLTGSNRKVYQAYFNITK
jgi:hypothetical protein